MWFGIFRDCIVSTRWSSRVSFPKKSGKKKICTRNPPVYHSAEILSIPSPMKSGRFLVQIFLLFFTLVTGPSRSLGREMSDTRVYEPQIRARLRTTAHFCQAVVLVQILPKWEGTREQKMLKGHPTRIIYHHVYLVYENNWSCSSGRAQTWF